MACRQPEADPAGVSPVFRPRTAPTTWMSRRKHQRRRNREPAMPEHRLVELDAFIGGYLGDSYRVSLAGDALLYEHLSQGYTPHERREIHPTPEQWAAF